MILYLFEDACFTCHCYRAPQLFCSNSLKNYFACSSLSQGMGRVETRKTYLPFQQRYLAAIKRGGFNQNLKDLIALLNFFVYMNIFFLILNTLIIPFIFILFRVILRYPGDTECLPNIFFFLKNRTDCNYTKKKNLL